MSLCNKQAATFTYHFYRNFSASLLGIVSCLLKLNKLVVALKYIKNALKILKLAKTDANIDRWLAAGLGYLCLCLTKMHQPVDAISHAEKSLEIQKQLSANVELDPTYAWLIGIKGCCLLELSPVGSDALPTLLHSR